MRIPIHVTGLLISLWGPANSLFVYDKYVTSTGKRLHAGYVQKRKHVKLYVTPQLAANNTCMWFIGDLLYTHYKNILFIHYYYYYCVCVFFRVHIKRQQAQSINISKHPLRPTSINLNTNTTIHTLI